MPRNRKNEIFTFKMNDMKKILTVIFACFIMFNCFAQIKKGDLLLGTSLGIIDFFKTKNIGGFGGHNLGGITVLTCRIYGKQKYCRWGFGAIIFTKW